VLCVRKFVSILRKECKLEECENWALRRERESSRIENVEIINNSYSYPSILENTEDMTLTLRDEY
jgi:hypothetical protein